MPDDLLNIVDEDALKAEDGKMNDLLASLTEMRDPGAPVGPPAEKRRKTMPVPRISAANLKGCAIPRAPQGLKGSDEGGNQWGGRGERQRGW